ncbi:MAG: hypothetical protein B7X64_09695 [Halothiobacillus sp. 39-53-45]|nr:MAG: hypothetical protein B7X64_09695 [Halothiobacillus sp. 39-53-45]
MIGLWITSGLIGPAFKRRSRKTWPMASLPVAEWGDLLYGIGAASRYYFHKPPSALSPHEAAMLAAMLPNPRFYQANPASRGLQKRIRAVESRMNASRIP